MPKHPKIKSSKAKEPTDGNISPRAMPKKEPGPKGGYGFLCKENRAVVEGFYKNSAQWNEFVKGFGIAIQSPSDIPKGVLGRGKLRKRKDGSDFLSPEECGKKLKVFKGAINKSHNKPQNKTQYNSKNRGLDSAHPMDSDSGMASASPDSEASMGVDPYATESDSEQGSSLGPAHESPPAIVITDFDRERAASKSEVFPLGFNLENFISTIGFLGGIEPNVPMPAVGVAEPLFSFDSLPQASMDILQDDADGAGADDIANLSFWNPNPPQALTAAQSQQVCSSVTLHPQGLPRI